MRIIPILTAILVMVGIYVLVFDRGQQAKAIGAPDKMAQSNPSSTAESPDTSVPHKVGVIAIHSSASAIDSAVDVRGETESDRQVEVRAETAGPVISKSLPKGSFVKAGDLLCEIDAANRSAVLAEARARLNEARARVPEAEARLDEAKARLAEAKINDNAATKLSKGGFASDTRVASTNAAVSSAQATLQAAMSGLETTRAGIEGAQAAVEAAETEISRLRITAPFDGLLESDTAPLGSLLQQGALCGTVIELDPIILVGYVTETDITRIGLGAPVRARLISGDEIAGKITFLSRAADPNTRTFRIEAEVPNPDLVVSAGQTVDISIAAEGTRAHLVPQSALTLNDDGTQGVRIVDADHKALFVPVSILRDTGKGMWLSGLPDQADIIIIGQEYVIDGVPVEPSFKDPMQ